MARNHARKFEPMSSHDDREIFAGAHARALYLTVTESRKIARVSSVWPKDEDRKRSRAKITTGVLLGGPRDLRMRAKNFTILNSREIARDHNKAK